MSFAAIPGLSNLPRYKFPDVVHWVSTMNKTSWTIP